VTPEQIIHHRRLVVLHQAGHKPVAQVCRDHGISRTTYYRWADRARRYGLDALTPKERRRPVMPNATPPHVVEAVLAEAVARPTLGAGRLVEHLAERGITLSASGVQKILVRHCLGRRAQRVRALAQITAADSGLVTDDARSGPFGFCHFAARPGDLVALDTFYVGRLKGVGQVWQLTAVDTATRWAVVELFVGDKTAERAVAFVDRVVGRMATIGVELRRVLSDNGPEFFGLAFRRAMAERGVDHHRIPPRSPNHNAVCERFQGTVLDEFYRPAFHRQRFDTAAQLDEQLQGWLHRYNTRRRNNGDFMRGRTPLEVLNSHR
jgi:transposase InsO family protein